MTTDDDDDDGGDDDDECDAADFDVENDFDDDDDAGGRVQVHSRAERMCSDVAGSCKGLYGGGPRQPQDGPRPSVHLKQNNFGS